MSYVADMEDIRDSLHEFSVASNKLTEVLEDAQNNSNFSEDECRLFMYMHALLIANLYVIQRYMKIPERSEDED